MTVLMKGHVWGKHKHKVQYPVIVEPKVDEIRCCVTVQDDGITFMSYADKPLNNMQQFAGIFKTLHRKWGYSVFDIGIEVNGNFNDSYRWVRSKTTPSDLNAEMVRIILFDLPHSPLPYAARSKVCNSLAQDLDHPYLYSLRQTFVAAYSEDEVDAAYQHFRSAGYEGAMVKDPKASYATGKRTQAWLKMKPEDPADGELIALHRATSIHGEPLDRIGSVTLRLEDGSEATPAGIPHALGKEMFTNPDKFIGTWWEFKYMERDRAGGYRHPSLVREREAKR